MHALDYFEYVRACAADRARICEQLDAMRALETIRGAQIGFTGKSSANDRMGVLIARLDAQTAYSEQLDMCECVIRDALALLFGCYRLRGVDETIGVRAAVILARYYVALDSWRDIAEYEGLSVRTCQRKRARALAMIDDRGLLMDDHKI